MLSPKTSLRRLLPLSAFVIVLALALAGPTTSQEGEHQEATWESFQQAVRDGRWWLKLRYRFENVDQDAIGREAHASTLRTVLGYETAAWNGLSVVLEFEDVSVIGNEQFDAGPGGSFPVVADPEGSEINQVHLAYAAPGGVNTRLGRQVIKLDDDRFIGDVGWRQNQQTFDAAMLEWKDGDFANAFYAFLENVNLVTGADHRMASHLLNAGVELGNAGRLSGFAYLLDYDDVLTRSTDTFGARFKCDCPAGGLELGYLLEGALQQDAGDNPNSVDQSYLRAVLSGTYENSKLRVGHETLGGSGDPGDAFQTPLATLHAHNGWADKFLTTPDTGLVDLFVAAEQRVGSCKLQLIWHQFEADSGSADYGTELDAALIWSPAKSVQLGLKAASYDADDFATDTDKVWLWLAYAP